MKRIIIALSMSFLLISLNAQQIEFDPDTLEATVTANSTVTVTTVLSNTGDQMLEFAFPGYNNRAWGGPDDFGYYWIDSDEEGGPGWEYTDISETGTLIEGFQDDNTLGPFEFGFDFPFYGSFKSLFYISANGCITFTDQEIPYVNEPIPTYDSTTNFIAWFWDDLQPLGDASKVFIKHFENKVIVQFNKFVQYEGSEAFIFGQVVMQAGGDILLKYRHIYEGFDESAGTVGIQAAEPGMGLQVVCNAPYLHPEMIIRFDYPGTFIHAVEPASGLIGPGQQETIWIVYNSEGYEPGTHTADLKCISNDPVQPEMYTHHIMHVETPVMAGFTGFVTDATTGLPIPEVKVRVGEQYVFTNELGHYEFPLEQGKYNVKFQKEGYETVIIEDTTALPGFSTLDVEMSGFYFMVGRVWANENPIETGFAYCYKMEEGVVVDVFAEMVGEEGYYEFSGMPSAQYILKAEPSPNSIYYGLYLPTYYGDVLHWEDASMINLTQNTDGLHIQLVPVNNSQQGTGAVSGQITLGINNPPAANIPIILESTTSDFSALTFSATDGTFSFTSLLFNTYELYAEIPGKSIVPILVTIDENTSTVSGISMMILEEEIIFVGIGEPELFEYLSQPYPNPASDKVTLTYWLKEPLKATLSVMDHLGRQVSSMDQSLDQAGQISMDISNLKTGNYYIRISSTSYGNSIRTFTKF
jgi:hypothetical protein